MARITNADIIAALERLSRALDSAGVGLGAGRDLDLRQPYGQVWYVVSYDFDARWRFDHDVPGFRGSSGGFASKREAHDAIAQTARTLFDLADMRERV
jgi:hypothetical protein